MPEPVLISKPAELVEAGEFNALTKRVENIEGQLSDASHAIFGFKRESDNVWVDGLLQQMADARKTVAIAGRTIALAAKIALPFVVLGALSVFGNFLHNYQFSHVAEQWLLNHLP